MHIACQTELTQIRFAITVVQIVIIIDNYYDLYLETRGGTLESVSVQFSQHLLISHGYQSYSNLWNWSDNPLYSE
jgi:hypothetical protein